MKIFSIDPGSQSIGWAAFDGDRLEGSGRIKIPDEPIERQCQRIERALRENWVLLREVLVVEGFYRGSSQKCALFTGIVISALARIAPELPIEFMPPDKWKKAVFGRAGGDKERCRDRMMEVLGWKPEEKRLKSGKNKGFVKITYPSQDELDAIGIGLGWARLNR